LLPFQFAHLPSLLQRPISSSLRLEALHIGAEILLRLAQMERTPHALQALGNFLHTEVQTADAPRESQEFATAGLRAVEAVLAEIGAASA